MRTIPKKNYIFLGLLAVVTILAVIYMSKWYCASESYHLENSVMKNLVGEVKEVEFDNYILENPEVVIYITNEQSESTKKFEKNLKKYILDENLKAHFIYINGNEVSEKFLSQIKQKYFVDKLKNVNVSYPNLFVLEEGKVVDVLYQTASLKRDIKDVKPFLQENGVLENA